MAKARKEGKKKKSRKSVNKTLRLINRNNELIKKYMEALKNG
jgi:hypothetical protein